MKVAITMLDKANDRPGYLVLMTDGEPTVGETTIAGLMKGAENKRDIRMFDFGVGYDVNTLLLDKIAAEHHGTAQYVEPGESIENTLSSFYQKIKSPVLSDVHIEYDGIQVKDVYPREVKDIFAGSQVLLLGRYKGNGDATVKLTGTINGVKKAYSFPVKFNSEETDHTYLPRLWAMRRIAHLTEVARENGNTREVVDEIVALSKQYGMITAYTSFLVTDPAENARLRGGGGGGGWSSAWGGAETGTAMGTGMGALAGSGMSRSGHGHLPSVSMGKFVHAPGDNAYTAGSFATDKARMKKAPATSLDSTIASIGSGSGGVVFGDEGTSTSEAPSADFAPIASADGPVATTGHPSPMLMAWGGSRSGGGYGKGMAARSAREPVGYYRRAGAAAPPPPSLPQPMLKADDGLIAAVSNLSSMSNTGKDAVKFENNIANLNNAFDISNQKEATLKSVEGKSFKLVGDTWVDTSYQEGKSPKPEEITFGSKEYFDLLKQPGVGKFLAIGKQVLFVHNNHAYRITFKADA
jgi:hypothetical protein